MEATQRSIKRDLRRIERQRQQLTSLIKWAVLQQKGEFKKPIGLPMKRTTKNHQSLETSQPLPYIQAKE